MNEAEKSKRSGFKSKRSRILYEITGLIVVVMVISGLVTFFLVNNSQNKLIDKSVDKVVETESNNIASALDYLMQRELESETGLIDPANLDVTQFLVDVAQKKVTDLQKKVDDTMSDMVDSGFFDLEYVFVVVPPSSFMGEAFVLLSGDESMVYTWEVPAYLLDAIDTGEPYLLLQDGVPELGLEGVHLVVLITRESPGMEGLISTTVCVIPMQERIDAINAYYDEERNSVSLTLGLSVFLSILAMIIIVFFVLNYLIHRRITEPIDRLSAEAEEIMQGNLDLEVEVHEGGEFQGLEAAFKQMVESILNLINRSTGEE